MTTPVTDQRRRKSRHRHVGVGLLVAFAVLAGLVGVATAAVVRFRPDPASAGGVNGSAAWVAEVVGDELWVGGDFLTARDPGNGQSEQQRRNLVVLDFNTGLIKNKQFDANDRVFAIETDGDMIWVGGEFTSIAGQSRRGLAAFDARTGAFVNSFGARPAGQVRDLLLHEGWLYVAGEFDSINGSGKTNLVRVDPVTGALDPGFTPNPNARVSDIDAHGDVIYLAGVFTRLGPPGERENENYAAGVFASTGIEAGTYLDISTEGADAIVVSDDGRHVYVGDRDNNVTKHDPFSRSIVWQSGGEGNIQALALDGDVLYVGLHDGWYLDGDDLMLVGLDTASGANIKSYELEMNSFWGVRGLTSSPQGLIATGEFTSVRGVSARRIAILRPVGNYQPAMPLPTLVPTPTPTPVPTATPTPTPVPTATPIPTATPTPIPTATPTPIPTATPTPIPTATATPTPIPTATPTPAPTATPVPVATATPQPTAAPTLVPAPSATPLPQAPAPSQVMHAVSCLAGNGRVDTNIVNTGDAQAIYRIEFQGLTARQATVSQGNWWRLPITGRADNSYDVVVKRNGDVVSQQAVTVACDTNPPALEDPEVRIINACRGGFGYILFQFVNGTENPKPYIIEFEGVSNRSTTAAPFGAAVRAVTGRQAGSYEVRVRSGLTPVSAMTVDVDCS